MGHTGHGLDHVKPRRCVVVVQVGMARTCRRHQRVQVLVAELEAVMIESLAKHQLGFVELPLILQ